MPTPIIQTLSFPSSGSSPLPFSALLPSIEAKKSSFPVSSPSQSFPPLNFRQEIKEAEQEKHFSSLSELLPFII
jgi:hypothetical protein